MNKDCTSVKKSNILEVSRNRDIATVLSMGIIILLDGQLGADIQNLISRCMPYSYCSRLNRVVNPSIR